MEKLLVIIVLLVILGVLPLLRTNFLVIAYLQKYFFKTKNFWYFLKSKEGLGIFFGTHIFAYGLTFALFALSFYFANNRYFFDISYLLVAILVIDNFLIIYNVYKSRLAIPKTSYRVISLFSVSILFQITIFLLGYFTQHFFVAAFVLLVFPYIIIAIAHCLLYPIFYLWSARLLVKAKHRFDREEDMISVGLLGNYGKSTTSHLLSTVFAQHKHLKGSSQYHHFTGLLQSLLQLEEDTTYLFTELGIHNRGDTVKFCQFLGADVLFLTGIDLHYYANFTNKHDLLQEYLSFQEQLHSKSKLYIHHEVIGQFPENFLENLSQEYVIYGSQQAENIHAYCYLKQDNSGNTHVFGYHDKQFNFKSNVDSRYNLSNLAGVLAFYVDQGHSLDEIIPILAAIEADQTLFKEYQMMSGLKILECPKDKTIRGLWSGLEYIEDFDSPHFLIIDKIPGLRSKRSKAQTHFDLGKKLASYGLHKNLEKIFLVNKYYAKSIRKGLIAGGYDESKIYYRGDLGLLRHITKGVIFVKGEGSSKIFRRIVLRQ